MSKKISILNFSPRIKGNCNEICREIELFHQTNVSTFSINFESFPPCHSCDYECLNPGESCPEFGSHQRTVMDAVCNSDLVYFVIPNYCGYPCANYFAFNERSVGYFNLDRECMARYMNVKKKFIIVSNTDEQPFVDAMKQQTHEAPEILFLKTRKYGTKSTAGDLMKFEAARSDLRTFLIGIP